MKKLYPILIMCLLFGSLMIIEHDSVQAAGNSKEKKAIEAYQKYLGNDYIKWNNTEHASKDFEFSLVDINKDDIPELVLKCNTAAHYEGSEAVYSYYKKKVKLVARSDKVKSYYPKRKSGIVELYYYGMGDAVSYYKISKGGKAKLVASADSFNDPMQNAFYSWDNKKVTASEFESLLKKLTGKKKVTIKKKDWHKNTAKNRENMSKLIR